MVVAIPREGCRSGETGAAAPRAIARTRRQPAPFGKAPIAPKSAAPESDNAKEPPRPQPPRPQPLRPKSRGPNRRGPSPEAPTAEAQVPRPQPPRPKSRGPGPVAQSAGTGGHPPHATIYPHGATTKKRHSPESAKLSKLHLDTGWASWLVERDVRNEAGRCGQCPIEPCVLWSTASCLPLPCMNNVPSLPLPDPQPERRQSPIFSATAKSIDWRISNSSKQLQGVAHMLIKSILKLG